MRWTSPFPTIHGSLPPNSNSTRNYLYAQGEPAVIEYFSEIKEYAGSPGITVAQTHGRGTGLYGDAENDGACLQDARLDCIATRIPGAKHCVMHGPPSYLLTASIPEKVRELHFKTFSSIIPRA